MSTDWSSKLVCWSYWLTAGDMISVEKKQVRQWQTAFSRLECELSWGVLEVFSRNGLRLIPGLTLHDNPFHSLHSSASERSANFPTEKKNALVSFDSWPLALITMFRHGPVTS